MLFSMGISWKIYACILVLYQRATQGPNGGIKEQKPLLWAEWLHFIHDIECGGSASTISTLFEHVSSSILVPSNEKLFGSNKNFKMFSRQLSPRPMLTHNVHIVLISYRVLHIFLFLHINSVNPKKLRLIFSLRIP